jgi:hypothetical protein
MYTLITTFPANGSRNVGDKLIEHSLRQLIKAYKPAAEFITFFREDNLHEHIKEINKTRAVLLPAFAIRDTPLTPYTYNFSEAFLSDLKVPLIPVGSNWNAYPGDYLCQNSVCFSEQTTGILKHISSQTEKFSCREYHTCALLKRHGISNTIMTGDPAWYEVNAIGKPLKISKEIKKIVFTPPLSPFYLDQSLDLMQRLDKHFPNAEKVCSFHLCSSQDMLHVPENSGAVSPAVLEKDTAIIKNAKQLGYEILNAYEGLDTLEDYKNCDFHVGYECHAHLFFLRYRIPSLLIHEDARGTGFSYTLGGGGISGYQRSSKQPLANFRKTITSGYCTSREEYEIAPPSSLTNVLAMQYLEEEIENGFVRIQGVMNFIDITFKKSMKPFLKAFLL